MIIYTLETYDGCIFYVGSTNRSLKSRLNEHKYRSKHSNTHLYQFTKSINNQFTISEIDKGTIEDEIFYTHYFKFLGFNLMNRYAGQKQCFLSIEEKDRKKQIGSKSGKLHKGKVVSIDTINKMKLTKQNKTLAYLKEVTDLLSQGQTISQICDIYQKKDKYALIRLMKKYNIYDNHS